MRINNTIALRLVFTAAICLCGCFRPAVQPAIVGAWYVNIPAAPYPHHLFLFHADGTVIQSNPDSGDARYSDSNLIGAWSSQGGHVAAKLVETMADRDTHKYVGRTELTMSLEVEGNSLRGTGTALFYELGRHDGTPHPFDLAGSRIQP